MKGWTGYVVSVAVFLHPEVWGFVDVSSKPAQPT